MHQSIIILITTCCLPVLLAASDASQWRGGPARTGQVVDPAAVFVAPTSIALEELWHVPMPGEAAGGHSSVAVAGDAVYAYVSRDGEKRSSTRPESLVCVALADGTTRWQADWEGGRGRSPNNTPSVVGDAVYVISGGYVVRCFDAASGAERWQTSLAPDEAVRKELEARGVNVKKLREPNASITVVDDLVVAAPFDVVGLDAATGRIRWRQSGVSVSAASPVVWRHDGTAYLAVGDEELSLLDASDGRVCWTLPEVKLGFTTPCLSDDLLAVAVYRDKKRNIPYELKGIDLHPDQPSVRFAYGWRTTHQAPATDGERIYLCNRSRACIDAGTGEEIWRHGDNVVDHFASFIVVGDTLISWTAPHRQPMGKGVSKVAFYRRDDGEQIAVCDVTRLGECVFPKVAGDRLVWRGLESLWCYRAVRP